MCSGAARHAERPSRTPAVQAQGGPLGPASSEARRRRRRRRSAVAALAAAASAVAVAARQRRHGRRARPRRHHARPAVTRLLAGTLRRLVHQHRVSRLHPVVDHALRAITQWRFSAGAGDTLNFFNRWIFDTVTSKSVVVSCTLRAWPRRC